MTPVSKLNSGFRFSSVHRNIKESKVISQKRELYESITQRIDNHPIYQIGYPKEGAVHGYKPEYVMVRVLQRHPNGSVQHNLSRLHMQMANIFSGMSDEALDWLLGGSRAASIGGFKTAEQFREFLDSPSDLFTSAQLISQLETILAAIAYRSRGVPCAEQPILAETAEQKKMFQLVCDITEGQVVRQLSSVYPDKTTGWVMTIDETTTLDEVIVCDQDDELSDDEDSLFRGAPDTRIPPAYYKVNNEDNQPSWIAQAREQDIPVRRHVSGTSALSMAAAMGLLCQADQSNAPPFSCEQEARDFFTALFIPKYLRSDYHSIAETQAGIDHFMAENVNCAVLGSSMPSKPISPKEAQERAYEAIWRATCDNTIQFGVNPSNALKEFQALMASQKQIAAQVGEEETFVSSEDFDIAARYDAMSEELQRSAIFRKISAPEMQHQVSLKE